SRRATSHTARRRAPLPDHAGRRDRRPGAGVPRRAGERASLTIGGRMSSRSTGAAFDPSDWSKKEFTERVRIATNAYVLPGIGYPPAVYLFHAVKLSLFVLGWMFFCSFTPGLGTPRNFTSWIFEGTAFQKAFLWASLVEVMGFGCMSGPLGIRIWPPFTA